jgi:hypothetical protein
MPNSWHFVECPWDTPQKMTLLQKFYVSFVPERHFCGVSRHSAKKWESGIWLEICKIICDSRNWDSTLPITPDHSWFFPSKNYRQKLGEIGSRFFPRIPDHQLTFPIIPDFPRMSRVLKLDPVWGGFSGRCCHAAGFALEGTMVPCPCIATDNGKGEHSYYIS